MTITVRIDRCVLSDGVVTPRAATELAEAIATALRERVRVDGAPVVRSNVVIESIRRSLSHRDRRRRAPLSTAIADVIYEGLSQ